MRNISFKVSFTHCKKLLLVSTTKRNKSSAAGTTAASAVRLQLPMLTNQATFFYWKLKAGRCYND